MDIAICRICLEKTENYRDIFDESGVQQNIQAIVNQHLWYQVVESCEFRNKICLICWETIYNFHNFYKKIENLHKTKLPEIKSESDTIFNEFLINDDDEITIKSELSISVFNDPRDDGNITDGNDESGKEDDGSPDFELESSDSEEDIKPKIKRQTRSSINNVACNDEQSEEDWCKQPKPKRKYTKRGTKLVVVDEEKVKNKELQREIFLKQNEQIRQFCKMECDLCSEKLVDFANANKHYRLAHKIKGYLICCGRKLAKRNRVINHISRHINPDAFKCEICDRKFLERNNLNIHMKNVHPTEKASFQCDVCPKAFYTNYRLVHHKQYHNEKLYQCKECDKSFINNSSLQMHIRIQHEDAYMQICDICAKTFKTRLNLRTHMKYVHGEFNKIQCPECNAWVRHEEALKRHIRLLHVSTGEKFICTICGKEAPNKGALNRHNEYMHKLQRTHTCDLCDKSFKRALSLKEHMTTHTGEVLYTCPFCPKTFNSSANMHAHKKKMHPVEWAESKQKD